MASEFLIDFPDRNYVEYIVRGLRHWFDLGFRGGVVEKSHPYGYRYRSHRQFKKKSIGDTHLVR